MTYCRFCKINYLDTYIDHVLNNKSHEELLKLNIDNIIKCQYSRKNKYIVYL